MLVRIIILILLILNYKKIYKYFITKNLFSFNSLKNSIDNVTKLLTTSDIKKEFISLKQLDKNAYKEVRKRLSNIEAVYQNIREEKDISLRNEYQNIKEEKRMIRNRIHSTLVSKGLNNDYLRIIKVIDKYIDEILENILDERDKRGINVEWFEGILYEPVNPYDPKINYNYDVYL